MIAAFILFHSIASALLLMLEYNINKLIDLLRFEMYKTKGKNSKNSNLFGLSIAVHYCNPTPVESGYIKNIYNIYNNDIRYKLYDAKIYKANLCFIFRNLFNLQFVQRDLHILN